MNAIIPQTEEDDAARTYRIAYDGSRADRAREQFELLRQQQGQQTPTVVPGETPAPPADADTPPALVFGEEPTQEPDEQSLLQGLGAVVGDILTGVSPFHDLPDAVLGGLAGAANQIVEFAGDIEESLGLGGPLSGGFQIRDPETGELDIRMLSGEELDALRARAGDDAPEMLPVAEPDSMTGQILQSMVQFLALYIPARGQLGAINTASGGALGTGVIGSLGRETVAGAIADLIAFDPDEGRLSTMLNQVPGLSAVVPDYLAEDDPERESDLERRFKNVLEGAGIGFLADGVTQVLRAYKARRALVAQGATDPQVQREIVRRARIDAAAREQAAQVSDEMLARGGAIDGDLVELVELTDRQRRGSRNMVRGNEFAEGVDAEDFIETHRRVVPRINVNAFNSEDDVLEVLQRIQELDAEAIEAARRGVVSDASTASAAHHQLQTPEQLVDFLGREPGENFRNPAQAAAATNVMHVISHQLEEAVEAALRPDATAADMYLLTKTIGVHATFQRVFAGARAEAGRTLRALAIPAQGSTLRAERIAEIIEQTGGIRNIRQHAEVLREVLSQPNGRAAAAQVAREAVQSGWRKGFFQLWINGLLSSPKTLAINALSNQLTSLWAVPERLLAAGISRRFYGGEIDYGEVASMAYGMVQGMRDGAVLMTKGAGSDPRGISPEIADIFQQFVKIEGVRADDLAMATRGTAERMGLDVTDTAIGRGIDYAAGAFNLPSIGLQKTDSYFKAVNYRMQLRALAYRQAHNAGLVDEALEEAVQRTLANPPSELIEQAIQHANVFTFTNKLGPIGSALQRARDVVPGARFVVPFIRTPSNIMRFAFERTPLAPLSSQVRAQIRAGGAEAAEAWAKMGFGTGLMLTVSSMVSEGHVTGFGDPDPRIRNAMRDQGWQPYSIRVGDKWVRYSRFDPIGTLIGLAADVGHLSRAWRAGTADGEDLILSSVLALTQNLSSKTWMQGAVDFIAAIDPGNPTRNLADYAVDLSATMVPYSSFLRNVAQAEDPIVRRPGATSEETFEDPVLAFVDKVLQARFAQTPGMTEFVPARLNIWGEPISRESGVGWLYDFMSPIQVTQESPDPVNQAIIENRVAIEYPKPTIQGVRLTAEEYTAYIQLAGSQAHATLQRLVGSRAFDQLSDGPEGGKAAMITNIILTTREAARSRMMADYPALRERILETRRGDLEALTRPTQETAQ